MIETILHSDVAVPTGFVESVLRQTGAADRASIHPSPAGDVVVVRRGKAVTGVAPEGHAETALASYERRTGVPAYPDDDPPTSWAERIDEALATGDARRIQTDLLGVTEFQRSVLAATSTIPVGETRPYAWIAREAGHAGAVRAVGTALGRNPIPLLIPCHRVVRSDGSLGQYAFGPEMKGVLLDSEHAAPRLEAPLVASQRGTVVCYPTCRHARRIRDVVAFRSTAEAVEAGYRPCRICRPV